MNFSNLMFDSYIEASVKEGERKGRADCEPLELLHFTLNTKIPVQIDRFWACPTNKHMLQMLCRDFFMKTAVRLQRN